MTQVQKSGRQMGARKKAKVQESPQHRSAETEEHIEK